jgi:site-specific DNA recombinase
VSTLGYVRVSTEEQARGGLSLDAQRDKITAYCHTYDLDPVELLADNGKSAKNLARAGMQELLGRVEEGQVQAVVCYKLDRMFRNVLDGLTTLELFRDRGVAFHSVCEQLNTATAMGQFALNMMLAFGQLERQTIGERTRDVLRARKQSPGGSPVLDDAKRRGKLLVGTAPYGYRFHYRKLVPVPDEMTVVELVLNLADEGLRSPTIAKRLNAAGFATRVGTPWTQRQVRRLLGRPYLRAAIGLTAPPSHRL